MNSTIANKNHANASSSPLTGYDRKQGPKLTNSVYENYNESDQLEDFGKAENLWIEDNLGFDFQRILSMEILETVSDPKLVEARNDEILKRVAEMQKLVENSEQYLTEHGEIVYKNQQNNENNHSDNNAIWQESSVDKLESDNESSHSRMSSLDDTPGTLKHSDSLILLTETINQGLNGISTGLNSILPPASTGQDDETLKNRQSQGLSAILNNCGLTDALIALSNDLSQSESDNDSLYTPTNSPIHRHQNKSNSIQAKAIRTSFGLHSPDNPNYSSSQGAREQNLREYLHQLRENSNHSQSSGIASEMTGDLTGSENRDSGLFTGDLINMIDLDPDLIDLTLLPPPQTPDELDSATGVSQVLAPVPSSFADNSEAFDRQNNVQQSKNIPSAANTDFENFLATVTIEPPTMKVTPAVELTPEEIMSYIIPPPPTSNGSSVNYQDNVVYSNEAQIRQHQKSQETLKAANGPVVKGNVSVSEIRDMFNAKSLSKARNSLIINEKNIEKNSFDVPILNVESKPKTNGSNSRNSTNSNGHVIEYPTVERKGVFSCCTKESKSKSEEAESPEENVTNAYDNELKPPPRASKLDCPKPPERPPKSILVTNSVRPRSNSFSYSFNGMALSEPPENRFNTLNNKKLNFKMICEQNGDIHHEMSNGFVNDGSPPCIPPRGEMICNNIPPHILMPPKKPPLPPVPSLETLRMKAALKNSPPNLKNGSEPRVASIGSPHFQRNPNLYRDIELEHQSNAAPTDLTMVTRARTLSQPECTLHCLSTPSTPQVHSKTGHVRSHSETKNTILKNREMNTVFSLCSPQMNRKFTGTNPSNQPDLVADRGFNTIDNRTKPQNFNSSTLRPENSSPQMKSNHVRFKDQYISDSSKTNTLPSPLMRQKLTECALGGNGHVVSVETLLQKTEVAVDGLLARLHQVAQSCSHQHAHGGGEDIDERKFQVTINFNQFINMYEQPTDLSHFTNLLLLLLNVAVGIRILNIIIVS